MSGLRLAVLVSGRGSNLRALVEEQQKQNLGAEVVCVLSDKEKAFALHYAEEQNIPAFFVNPKNFKDKEEFEKELLKIIKEYQVDYILLAGFMRLLSPYFIRNAGAAIINIHPSLLPSFPGLAAQKQALEYGVRYSGCTIHFIDEGMDTGPVIMQTVVPVLPGDTEESLSERILKEEHRLYPQVVKLLSEDRIKWDGKKVIILEEGEKNE